jgi:hypothetical protein
VIEYILGISIDVCGVLTGNIDAGAYGRKLKQRLSEEGR